MRGKEIFFSFWWEKEWLFLWKSKFIVWRCRDGKKYASTWIWLIANDMKGKNTCDGDISCKTSSFNCSIVFTWWYEFFLSHLVLLKFILPLINLAATIAKAQKTGAVIISPNPISLLFFLGIRGNWPRRRQPRTGKRCSVGTSKTQTKFFPFKIAEI